MKQHLKWNHRNISTTKQIKLNKQIKYLAKQIILL